MINLPRMEREIVLLRTILEKSIDITKIPKATGNLRKVQLIKTTLLNITDIILKKYNIQFWLEYGTLIGAIRHKGFIPWDDDIDVCLLKENYLKLPKVFENELIKLGLTFKYGEKNGSQAIRLCYKDFSIDFFSMEYLNKRCNTKEEKADFVKKWLNVKQELFKNKKISDFVNNKINHFEIMPEADELKKQIIDKNYFQNPETKQIIRSVETMSKTDKCAVFEMETIFPLQELDFEGTKLPAPKNPLQHLYEANEYGEYGAVMNFPTIRDSGFVHVQETYVNSDVGYDKILEEVTQILENIKAKVGV